MAARAIGSGTISFGLVSIPVKLFSTVDTTKSIKFNYLTEDGSRVKQQYVRADDGETVERADLKQGYEFAKGQYVLFSPDEIKAMNVKSTNTIEIAEFIPLAEIERIYIEKVNYLGPDKGAARSYHLLREALSSTGRAALASYAARGKSYLVLIRPMEDGLVMEQLKHADELRPFEDVPLDTVDVDAAELDLAVKIIEQRINDAFEPDKYEDVVRSRMTELIQQKIDGQEISVPEVEHAQAQIIDLMDALKASVRDKAKAKSAANNKKKTAKATPRKTAARASRKATPAKAKTGSQRKAK